MGLSPLPSGFTTLMVPGGRELQNAITLPSGDQVGIVSDGGGGLGSPPWAEPVSATTATAMNASPIFTSGR